MAESQSNARLRADAGAPTSGVIHVRTRLTADFTVLSNALAQRRGSAVTVGVAAYISSLPSGTCVSIAALCAHFDEGEIRISRALRELEAAGYLERRRERTTTGQVRTRTYFHDIPGIAPEPTPDPDGTPEPPVPPRPRGPRRQPAPAPSPATATATARRETTREEPLARPEAETPLPLTDADPRAVAVLARLRHIDPRLVLSEREAARLAPAVGRWLAAGLLPTHITDHLTTGLPDHLLVRPAGILAYRLKETPLPASFGHTTPPPTGPAPTTMRNCDGCDRGFRSTDQSHCRDCRQNDERRLPDAA
ncbi:hypothetical protein WB401_15655 [Streptomyces brasiliscabiei]|uniref:DNA-binding protein n=1 Tax=Streptomyces brasiliscabiei TaxID=2736302 RepID=A0ABU8GHN4_9ACTN